MPSLKVLMAQECGILNYYFVWLIKVMSFLFVIVTHDVVYKCMYLVFCSVGSLT